MMIKIGWGLEFIGKSMIGRETIRRVTTTNRTINTECGHSQPKRISEMFNLPEEKSQF